MVEELKYWEFDLNFFIELILFFIKEIYAIY